MNDVSDDEAKPDLTGTAAARNFGGELRPRTGVRPEIPQGFEVGETYPGEIASIVAFGLFVAIEGDFEGLVHRSAIEGVDPENRDAADLHEMFAIGDMLAVEVVSVDRERNRAGLKLI